jgi:hypothetical protein
MPDCPADSPAVAKKLPSSAVQQAAGFFRPRAGFLGLDSGPTGPGAELSTKKKHQHENSDNFCHLNSVFNELGLVGITTMSSTNSSIKTS